MTSVNMKRAHLGNANQTSANCTNACMSLVHFVGAQLESAVFNGADLLDANSKGAKGVEKAKVDGTTAVSGRSGSFEVRRFDWGFLLRIKD